jgi:hypothetical protein
MTFNAQSPWLFTRVPGLVDQCADDNSTDGGILADPLHVASPTLSISPLSLDHPPKERGDVLSSGNLTKDTNIRESTVFSSSSSSDCDNEVFQYVGYTDQFNQLRSWPEWQHLEENERGSELLPQALSLPCLLAQHSLLSASSFPAKFSLQPRLTSARDEGELILDSSQFIILPLSP